MILRHFSNFSVQIILLNCLLLKYVTANSAWFQVCDEKQKYALSSVDCELGLWLNKPLKVNCICVNGVWVINEDLCDNNVMIVVGSGDCFTLRKPIRSVKLLGKPDDPFASVSYVTDENFDVFTEIPQKDYNHKLDSHSSYVISIFPQKALRRSDHGVCLVNAKSPKPVHIWKNARRVSTRFKFVVSNKCESTSPYDFHVGFGQIYQSSEVLVSESEKPDCSRKCLAAPYELSQKRPGAKALGRGLGRSVPTKPLGGKSSAQTRENVIKSRIDWRDLYAVNKKLLFDGGLNLKDKQIEYQKNITIFRWPMTLPALSHSREIREQSVRMVQAQTNFLLLNQPPPKIKTIEFDYFQKLRQVFVALVPDDVISHDIVTGLMRMFRVLLWESHDKFEYQQNPNLEQYDRIMKPLNECLWNVTEYPFVFTDAVAPDDKTVPRAHNVHPCMERAIEVYWNDSEKSADPNTVKFIHTSENITEQHYINGTRESFNLKFDFVIELAWKIYLFGFYRCNNYFTETPTDAHELAERVQSLFNPRVARRWYQPEEFNKVLPLIFPKLNLTLFAWAVDKMTMGARDSPSTYDRDLFQKRPLYMSKDDIPHDNRLEDLGRSKRSTRGQKFREEPYWGNRAHCMFSFSDPIYQFKHAGKQGCYIGQET